MLPSLIDCTVVVTELHGLTNGYIALTGEIQEKNGKQKQARDVWIWEPCLNSDCLSQPLQVGDSIKLIGRRVRQPGKIRRIQVSKKCVGLAVAFNKDSDPEQVARLIQDYYYTGLPRVPDMVNEYFKRIKR